MMRIADNYANDDANKKEHANLQIANGRCG